RDGVRPLGGERGQDARLRLALAVLVDAFLVRATLMPAFMVAAGRANRWSPRSLRRVHHRLVG
ncbi:MAG: MMPL family transporter, partial [Acidimicrobiia bacterium]|nr:MMPL family transporter [Acidimicrobiia bacterium]